MAGESEGKETLDFSNTRAAYNVNLARLRERVKEYIDKHQYHSALFWADKLISLSNGTVEDVYWYAQTLYHTGQYHRAATLIMNRKLQKTHICCRYLAAKCYFEIKDYQEALNILDLVETNSVGAVTRNISFSINQSILTDTDTTNRNMESCVNILRGKVHEAMENRSLARECFREALRQDVYCYEAFDLLVSHHMLSSQEERELIDSLPFSIQCPKEEIELVKCLYENKLKKYDKPAELVLPDCLEPLSENLDIIVNLAERHYYNCDFRQCYNITTKVLNRDPYNNQCLPLHIAVLVELKKCNKLFYLAHKLVDLYPSQPVAWFAVGCYYLLINKSEPARRYLMKAATLNRPYGPAWLAFGHSFGAANEHDQAMAAYFTASQLMKGCHLPALYIGLEYGLTSNYKLADSFFNQALTIAPDDPFVLHEIGVISFQNEDFDVAERYFKDALKKVCTHENKTIVEKWEPLLNNLGHTCRKLKKYDEALQYHHKARILDPQSPGTYSAIGYVYTLMGDSITAIDYFHKALAIRRDDALSTTMLSNLMESLMMDSLPGEEMEDSPIFPAPTTLPELHTSQSTMARGMGPPPNFHPSQSAMSTGMGPPPILRLAAEFDDSSINEGDSSSLMIQEVEMDGC